MHDQYGVGLIVERAQKSLSGRGQIEACAGDVISCNPGEVHDGAPIGGAGRSWAMLYFDPERIASELGDILAGTGHGLEFELPRLSDSRTADAFRRLFRCLTEPRGSGAGGAEEALLALLSGLVLSRRAADPPAAAIAKVRMRLDDAPEIPVALSELAADAGLSRFQLLRAFEKATGLTPHAYLVQRRLQLARRLIARRMPLAEAAAASGFADQSHLTRLFYRSYGMTPGRFARGLR